jgi:proline iminopeptidase
MPVSPDTRPDAPPEPRRLHPPIEPHHHGLLDTGEGHRIHYEVCGNPQGLPVVVLHGGPGSGASPLQRRLFDPAVFRIVLFDQRGCGRSLPRGGIDGNDTAALVRDTERLRRHLGVDRWMVFGGSWGASLAITYAASHPGACLGLVLRGTFLTGSRDVEWFFGGAGALLPQAWEDLTAAIGLDVAVSECEHAGHAVLQTLARRLASGDAAAAAWARWEEVVTRRRRTDGEAAGAASPSLGDKYRVQAHYLVNECFLGEDRLLAQARALPPMPVAIVHGELDWVCRPANAWQLHRAIPGSRLAWVAGGGHDPYQPDMLEALAAAIDWVREASGVAA